ncbi:hypothetical protein G1C98_1559 [Bifidobacterium sp. DSM 109960]|uniref:Uncharacterized protein n=1 Tax=Bifidobacterium erythrocebi TaxID=2675325 RepID=A0A7Y0EVL7_9BIFI|nr:hypothetical protein [Bifidobacterium sp. DSM 109960]NMM96823.1 hypothetical protein [Bifidobacterium sp. DSM 109960]
MAAMKLTDEQRQAVDALSVAPEHAGESKLTVFRSLPARAKLTYFREHFLVPLLAAIIVIALATFMIVKAATPATRPKLYAAVIDSAITTTEAQQLQKDFSAKLGQSVNIDSYFDTSKDGLDKLQTMLSSKQIDVIIAPQSKFKQLAGYGYFRNLATSLNTTQRNSLKNDLVRLNGYDDADDDDPDVSGSGKGAAKPYGLSLAQAKTWNSFDGADSKALIGIAANTQNAGTAREFIDWLYR